MKMNTPVYKLHTPQSFYAIIHLITYNILLINSITNASSCTFTADTEITAASGTEINLAISRKTSKPS